MSNVKDNTLWCRYELKYRVDEARAEVLKRFLEPFLPMDSYSVKSGGYYTISSLYLDSDNLQLYSESMEGKQNRVKLRIRGYNERSGTLNFFEIKRRVNTMIVKSRSPVSRDLLETALAGQHKSMKMLSSGIGRSGNKLSDGEALDQFLYYRGALLARPKVLVRYQRLAYEGGAENRVRVTFDRDLCAKVTDIPEVSVSGPGWQPCPMSGEILEIKFTGRYPPWLSHMVKAFGLISQSMSKYTASINQSSLLGFCSPKRGCA